MSIYRRLEHHLTKGYVGGLVLIALLAGGAAFMPYKALEAEAQAFRVFSMIASQQNRIQHIALLSLGLAERPGWETAERLRSRLERAIAKLASDHASLMTQLRASAASPHEALLPNTYESLDGHFRAYLSNAQRLVKRDDFPSREDAELRLMLPKATSNLTAMLSKIYAAYRAEHEGQILRYKRLQGGGLLILLVVLVFEALFLFRPLVNSIKQEHREILKAREVADEANLVKTEFIANVSHEIRTPLTAIIGFSEMLLLSHQLSGDDRELGRSLRRNAIHLKALIDDLLDLSKIEANMIEVHKETISLNELVRDVTSEFVGKCKELGLRLNISYDTPLPANIYSDPVRIKQVLYNLLSNAVKFTSHGHISLNVRLQRDHAKLIFTVRDTGIGILKEKQALLFKAFSQIDGSKTRRQGGSGIGLVLSRHICQALGGNLTLKASAPGQGSTFMASFANELAADCAREAGAPASTPLAAHPNKMEDLAAVGARDRERSHEMGNSGAWASLPSPPPTRSDFGSTSLGNAKGPGWPVSSRGAGGGEGADVTAAQLRGRLAGVKVLLVEDGVDNRRIYKYFLELAGALVQEAVDGDFGVKDALRGEYDVVLMDIQMPKVDGYTATKLLKSHGYKKPIVALTAHAMNTEKDKCLAIGFSDYLAKPVTIPRLVAVIEKHSNNIEILPMIAKDQGQAVVMEKGELSFPAAPIAETDEPIKSLYHGNELFSSLLKDFGQALHSRVAELQTAVTAGNWKLASDVAHKMNGSAATYGYPILSKWAYEVELQTRQAHKDQVVNGEELNAKVVQICKLCERIIAGC